MAKHLLNGQKLPTGWITLTVFDGHDWSQYEAAFEISSIKMVRACRVPTRRKDRVNKEKYRPAIEIQVEGRYYRVLETANTLMGAVGSGRVFAT